MEISGAVRQVAGLSGTTRQGPAPKPAAQSAGGSVPAPKLPQEVVQDLAAAAGANAPSASRIRVDKATDRVVVEILDADNQVVKQIPAEALLHALAQSRAVTGLILDHKT